jgi:UDP-N-acetylmuramate dehydrogenase
MGEMERIEGLDKAVQMVNVAVNLDLLRTSLGDRLGGHLQEHVVLANYTTARTGGPADALLPVNTMEELVQAVQSLWRLDIHFVLLGSGSNVLVSDQGFRGVVVLNRARTVKVDAHHSPPTIWAESGANLSTIARQAGLRGLTGLEWAATVPGTLGGAVYGNAGAHGSNMQANLLLAEILHRDHGRETWPGEKLAFQYRSSIIKRDRIAAIILAARLKVENSTPADVQKKMDEFAAYRRRTQPPGATLGSMFKNPPGDYAGRLIEAAGLKGTRIGAAEISAIHANFFINLGQASAGDIYQLIQLARRTVANQCNVELELEIELIGDFT